MPPITEKELLTVTTKVINNRVTGTNGIPNIALKTAIKLVPAIFQDTYNARVKEGIFPDKWKKQIYHPLCMLDTAGKIFERIIHNRFEKVVHPLLAEGQFGYRKERSALEAYHGCLKSIRCAMESTENSDYVIDALCMT
ncbi:hypothetical protein KM043_015799 [Ampulex compressa]|nr:hypothetical protein KM043_015799 [Ampulex compressa]